MPVPRSHPITHAPVAPELPRLPPAASGRGGYYQDDGPGDDPPPNLMEVPDAVVKAEPYARLANRPYTVLGKTYTPLLNDEPFDELIEAGPFLIHAHIAEPGRGRAQTTMADHRAFFAALRAAGYDGHVTQTGHLPAYASPEEAATALKSLADSSPVR